LCLTEVDTSELRRGTKAMSNCRRHGYALMAGQQSYRDNGNDHYCDAGSQATCLFPEMGNRIAESYIALITDLFLNRLHTYVLLGTRKYSVKSVNFYYVTGCVVGSADTVECIDHLAGECTVEPHGHIVRRRVMS